MRIIGKPKKESKFICWCPLKITLFETDGCVGIERLSFEVGNTQLHIDFDCDGSAEVKMDDPAKLFDFIWKELDIS